MENKYEELLQTYRDTRLSVRIAIAKAEQEAAADIARWGAVQDETAMRLVSLGAVLIRARLE